MNNEKRRVVVSRKVAIIRKEILLGFPFLLFLIAITAISYSIIQFYLLETPLFVKTAAQGVVDDKYILDKNKTVIIEDPSGEEFADGEFPAINYGSKFGELSIESIGLESASVYCGDTPAIIRNGIGHFFGSRFPGQNGKVVLDAHVNKEFEKLSNCKVGDKVEFKTFYGTYVYEVTDTVIFNYKSNKYILAEDGADTLVAYTCYPPSNALSFKEERFAIICKKISGKSWINLW